MKNKNVSRNYGKTNRKMGHDAERYYAKKFRINGFVHCITSRKGSRQLDDAGVDLMNIPVNVQVKAGKQRGLNYSKELKENQNRVSQLLPPKQKERGYPHVLIHKKQVGRGRKRNKYDELTIMAFDDFIKILKMAQNGNNEGNGY